MNSRLAKLAVEQLQERHHARLVGLGPFRQLRHFELLHRWMQVTKHRGYAEHEIHFTAAIPHFHLRDVLCAHAEQRRLRLHRLEITADGDRFGDHRAVVEYQRWHALKWVDRGIFRRLVLLGHDVDLLARQRDAFFGKKNARPARIWRHTAVVELHDSPVPKIARGSRTRPPSALSKATLRTS